MEYNALRKLTKGINYQDFVKIKIAFLGNYSNQFLTNAIERHGRLFELNIETFEGTYNQTAIDILSPESELYSFNPEFFFLAFDAKPVKNEFHKLSAENKSIFANKFLVEIELYIKTLSSRINTNILFSNFIEEFDDVFNFLASKK
jgi:predicted enzyme involved in methoxymalonyl-ACP biosynthesis